MSDISTKLTYLNETKTQLKDTINLTGANILNDTFRSFPRKLYKQFLYLINNGTDNLYENLPKVNGTGTDITLNNTDECKIKFNMLGGNTIQDGTPTPDNPQEIKTVTGNNTIKVCGKNLLNFNNVDFTSSVTNWYFLNSSPNAYGSNIGNKTNIKIPVENGKTYTISYNIVTTPLIFQLVYEDESNIDGLPKTIGYNTFTFTSNRDGYVVPRLRVESEHNCVINNIMIEQNSSATEYQPYQSQTYPISLENIELCKIGIYQDYIYKNNGSWYLHKEIGKVVLDGSESWEYDSTYSRFKSTLFTTETMLRGQGYSNYYKYGDSVNNGQFDINVNKKRILIHRPDSSTTTEQQFQSWLSTHNTEVYYALYVPTDTPITNENVINSLESIVKSYEDTTYIISTDDIPMYLDVSAVSKYNLQN